MLGASPQVYHDGAPNAGLDALLARTDIDAVIVALPISVQPDIVRRALAAGKHVLSEKPVAKDVASGIALIKDYDETYKPKKLVWRVAENYEVETGHLRAGAIIRSGKIGKVGFYNVRVVNHVPKDSKWYNTPWRTIPDVSRSSNHPRSPADQTRSVPRRIPGMSRLLLLLCPPR